ncbi:MAG TPA: EamA family transporter [Armatimonadota bacterium]|nr:EamA family transporter [Armatimonadota bacterium]
MRFHAFRGFASRPGFISGRPVASCVDAPSKVNGASSLVQDPARLQAWLAWGAVSFLWGTTYLAIRVGAQHVPPALFAGSRFLPAGLILWAFCRLRGDRNPVGSEWRSLAAVGLLLLGIGNGLVVTAEQWVDSGQAALAVSMMPIWMAGLSGMLPQGERLNGRGILGLLLGITGLFLLLHPTAGATAIDARRLLGIGILEIACFSWAAGSLLSKRQKLGVSSLMGAAVEMMIAGIVLLGIAAATGEWRGFTPTWTAAAATGYLIVFGSLLGYGCYMFALSHLRATTVSLYAYVNPIVALVAGAILLHEPLSWSKLAAAGVILLGVALAQSEGIKDSQSGKGSD